MYSGISRGALAVVVVLLGGLGRPGPAAAQTILNAEALQPEDVQGGHFAVDGAFSLSGGNSEVVDLKGGTVLGYRASRHWVRVLSGAAYLAEDGAGLVDNRFVHLRYSYEFTPRVRSYHFAQLQSAKSLRLLRRSVLGSGLRGDVWKSPRTRLNLGSGIMLEEERLDPGRVPPSERLRVRAWRVANLAVLSHTLREDLSLINVVYVQPRVDELGDVRVLNDLALVLKIAQNLNLALNLSWRLDSRPPAGVERQDYALHTALSFAAR